MKSISTLTLLFIFAFINLHFPVQAQLGIDNIKICVFSDPHYFDTSLLINDGPAFQEYLNFDRKLLKESTAIMESLMDSLIVEQPDIVLVSGDLTKDGELICHQKMADYFQQLETAGTQVLVCPGNHDINNPMAVAFDGEQTYPVPSITPEDFKSIYADYGFNEAIATDTASLSYITEPIPGLQILSMDVCRYDSNYIANYPQTSGGFKPQVLQWAKDRIIDATSTGKVIIGMHHHNQIEHFTNQKEIFTEYVIDDWETVFSQLADLGLKVVFTGHFHAQDIRSITSPSGNILFDVETGSTVTWPCPYRIATLNTDTTLSITGKKVENINFDTGSLSFQEYGLQDLESGLPATIIHYLTSPPYSIDQGTAEFVEPAFTESMIAHYAGNEGSMSFNTSFIIWTLNLTGYGYIADALESVWDDFAPDDWNTTIDLKPYEQQIQLDLRVWLEGPYNGNNMASFLNPEFLPLQQPFINTPWLYTGYLNASDIPGLTIVDWVLIEIRDAINPESANQNTKVGRQIAFLLNDGTIVSTDGISPPPLTYSPIHSLFAVVYHRNHLPVMSAFPMTGSGGVYSYDFTIGAEQAYGGALAHKEIAPGTWGMIAGNSNPDGIVNMEDMMDTWPIDAGARGYLPGDFNLDSELNNQDKNDFWFSNINRQTQVPE